MEPDNGQAHAVNKGLKKSVEILLAGLIQMIIICPGYLRWF